MVLDEGKSRILICSLSASKNQTISPAINTFHTKSRDGQRDKRGCLGGSRIRVTAGLNARSSSFASQRDGTPARSSATRLTTSGALSITASRRRVAPSGCLMPCSQLRRVPGANMNFLANSFCATASAFQLNMKNAATAPRWKIPNATTASQLIGC